LMAADSKVTPLARRQRVITKTGNDLTGVPNAAWSVS
jgi:hypothetical protein